MLKRLRFIVVSVLCAGALALLGPARLDMPAAQELGASPAVAREPDTGASGLPIPRFVSLKSDRVNVRRGPSKEHQVAWVFSRKGLPVEVVAEYDNWRRVRDSEGEEGWVFHSLLAGERTALVAPWRTGKRVSLHDRPGGEGEEVAVGETGVRGRVIACDGEWCEFAAAGYRGWLEQTQLWGVYPGETIE